MSFQVGLWIVVAFVALVVAVAAVRLVIVFRTLRDLRIPPGFDRSPNWADEIEPRAYQKGLRLELESPRPVGPDSDRAGGAANKAE